MRGGGIITDPVSRLNDEMEGRRVPDPRLVQSLRVVEDLPTKDEALLLDGSREIHCNSLLELQKYTTY